MIAKKHNNIIQHVYALRGRNLIFKLIINTASSPGVLSISMSAFSFSVYNTESLEGLRGDEKLGLKI